MSEVYVCLNLQELYQWLYKGPSDYFAVCTKYSYEIRREENNADPEDVCNDYFDLYKYDSNLRLCCDGEQCKILEQTEEYIRLIDVENIDNEELKGIDTSFKLSLLEYEHCGCHKAKEI